MKKNSLEFIQRMIKGMLVSSFILSVIAYYKGFYAIGAIFSITSGLCLYMFLYGTWENAESKNFIGEVSFKFEKYPHYIEITRLDKVLVDFGFIKLVRRIKPEGYAHWVIEKASKIWNLKKWEWVDESKDYSKDLKPNKTYKLYAFTKDGRFEGNLDDLIWLLKYDVKPTKDSKIYWSESEQGYIGFSNRAAQVFKIGHKMFDSKWRPNMKELNTDLKSYITKVPTNSPPEEYVDICIQHIPFVLRGKHVITNKLMAYTAAKNFARYVS